MRRILLVLVREYLDNVRTKAFLFAVLMTPLLVGLSLLIPKWAESQDVPRRRVAVADVTGVLAQGFRETLLASKDSQGRGDRYAVEEIPLAGTTPEERERALEAARPRLDERVRAEELFAWVVLRPSALEKRPDLPESEVRSGVVGDFAALGHVRAAIEAAANAEIGRRHGVAPETARLLTTNARLRVGTVGKAGAAAATLAPIVVMFVLFLTIVGTSQALITSTLEEKANRVVEVLLSSVSPFQLMAGKVLGVCAVGLTLMAIWGGAGAATFAAQGYGEAFGSGKLLLALAYYLLGFLLIASVMVAVGSACNTLKEAQNLLSPVMIVLALPMLLFPVVMRDPNGTTATALSFVPPFTPFLMMMRIAQTVTPPAWQVAASLALLAASAVAVVWLASRVFRVGILLYGKPPSLREILRWVRSGA